MEYIWDPYQLANCGLEVLETCNGGLFFSVSCSAGHACIIACIAYMKINETIVMLVFLIVSYNTGLNYLVVPCESIFDKWRL